MINANDKCKVIFDKYKGKKTEKENKYDKVSKRSRVLENCCTTRVNGEVTKICLPASTDVVLSVYHVNKKYRARFPVLEAVQVNPEQRLRSRKLRWDFSKLCTGCAIIRDSNFNDEKSRISPLMCIYRRQIFIIDNRDYLNFRCGTFN